MNGVSQQGNKMEKSTKTNSQDIEKIKRRLFRKLAPYSADILDPFVLRYSLSGLQSIKVALMTILVFPLRLLIMIMLMTFTWAIGTLSLIGLPEEEAANLRPLSGWRRRWMKPFLVWIVRQVFAIGWGGWVQMKGHRVTAKEAPILLLTPHSSYWDTVLMAALGCPGMLVKDVTRELPLIGGLCRYTQAVYLNRDDPNSRQKCTEEIKRRAQSKDDWEQLVIFPEGACGNRKAIIQFKLGAFLPGVPVQPVFIRYMNKTDTITWTWEGASALKQFWMTLCQFRTYCQLEFLPVYNPSTEEQKNPRLFAQNVRSYVSKRCNIPVSHFSLEDIPYLKQARQCHLPATVGIAKLLRLRSKIGLRDEDAKTELQRLQQRNEDWTETRGNVELMAKYIGISPQIDALREFFRLMDQEGNGCLDICIYAAGLCLLLDDVEPKKRLDKALQVFGDSVNNVDDEHLYAILLLWHGIPKNLLKSREMKEMTLYSLLKMIT